MFVFLEYDYKSQSYFKIRADFYPKKKKTLVLIYWHSTIKLIVFNIWLKQVTYTLVHRMKANH